MQRNFERIQAEGVGLAAVKRVHVGRQHQFLGHLVVGIVVAKQQVHRNLGLVQAPHFAAEKMAGVVVFPSAIVQVASDHHEVNGLFNSHLHQA